MNIIIDKPMDYNGKGHSEIIFLAETTMSVPKYTNLTLSGKVCVVNTRGSHPCAYIQWDGIEDLESCEDVEYSYEFFDQFEGDMTEINFLSNLNHLGLKGTWLGWDYAHYGQWMQWCPPEEEDELFAQCHSDDKKYTTKEVASCAIYLLKAIFVKMIEEHEHLRFRV